VNTGTWTARSIPVVDHASTIAPPVRLRAFPPALGLADGSLDLGRSRGRLREAAFRTGVGGEASTEGLIFVCAKIAM
jgi:hypothetical protein